MDLAPLSNPSFIQACDNCRQRKVKCSHNLPCDKCQRLLLSCSYSDVLRRARPKSRMLYPLASRHLRPARNHPTRKQFSGDQESCDGAQCTPYRLSDAFSRPPRPKHVISPIIDSTPCQSQAMPSIRRISPQIIVPHVDIYLKSLFPIMPVVRGEQLRLDCQHPENLSPSRYALLTSLCALTRIQLKLDDDTFPDSHRLKNLGDGHDPVSGIRLLNEAVWVHTQCDIENSSLETLLTSLFLFLSYRNLNKHSHAWFYLCQATSMALALGLNRECNYKELTMEEADERRRVFWLLFIIERLVVWDIQFVSFLLTKEVKQRLRATAGQASHSPKLSL